MEDWEAIEHIRAAVADIERLRADSLQLLHESGVLLDQIDRINRPLIALPTAREQRSARRNFLFFPAAARSLLKRNIPETNKLSCAYKRATNTYGAGFQLSLCRSPPEHHLAWTASGPAKLRAFRKNMERKRRWIAIRRAAHRQQGYRTQNCRPPNPFGRC